MSVTDDIKARLDLLTYVSQHVPSLKKTGRYYKACCPFHDDKTPSFVVDPERGTWRCYGACGIGGDIFTFYQTLHQVEFKDALHELAREANIEIPKYNARQQVKQQQKPQLNLLNDVACFFHETLLNLDSAWFVREYLKTRGVSQASIQNFRLGYAPKHNIIPTLINRGHAIENLLELGIAYEADDGELRSRFYNRLMFPIMDRIGQVVGFGARSLGKMGAKYINSHESDIFQKSKFLYGWHGAHKAVRLTGELIVVEGYMDVIQAHGAGYQNVVGLMGTALTQAQIELFRDHYVKTLIFCLDGDSAGQQATERAIDSVIAHAHMTNIRIVSIPDDEDPDSLIKSGQWDDAIDSAIPAISYLIDRHVSQLPPNPSLGQRHAVANHLIPKLYHLENHVDRMWGVQELAYKLRMNGLALIDSAQKLMNTKPKKPLPSMTSRQLHPSADSHPIDAYVIYCLLIHPEWYWDIVKGFKALEIDMLDRTDFAVFGDIYEQIVNQLDVLEEGDLTDTIDFDLMTLSEEKPYRDAIVTNAARIRLNHIQRIIDQLIELRDLEPFNQFLAYKMTLTEKLGELI